MSPQRLVDVVAYGFLALLPCAIDLRDRGLEVEEACLDPIGRSLPKWEKEGVAQAHHVTSMVAETSWRARDDTKIAGLHNGNYSRLQQNNLGRRHIQQTARLLQHTPRMQRWQASLDVDQEQLHG